MYINRMIQPLLKKVSESFPAVLVTGPRQSGKTTLLRHAFPDADYVTFDDPVMQDYANDDPRGFISRYSEKQTILDEIQYVPQLFSYLKMDIDSHRSRYGQWLLTGSQQFSMMKNISDSLAGRIAILTLLPFSENELVQLFERSIGDKLWYGNYPELVLKPDIRNIWIPSYIRTYLERDVRSIINVQDLSLFQTFLGLCTANHGRELNIAGISRDCGVTQPTIKRWVSILQTSFIIYLLKPFYNNMGKRLIRSPKQYFIDASIPAYLTRQSNPETLFDGPMGGVFFEGYIIIETLKILQNKEINADLYFWRSHDGMEIDLILETNGTYHAIEIKKTKTPTQNHAESLEKFRLLMKEKAGQSFVVCNITESKPLIKNVSALPWQEFLEWVDKFSSH